MSENTRFLFQLKDKCNEETAVFMLVRSIQSLQVHGSDEFAVNPLLLLVYQIYFTMVSFLLFISTFFWSLQCILG